MTSEEPQSPVSYEKWLEIHKEIFEQHKFPVEELGQLLYKKLLDENMDANLYFSIDTQADPTLVYTPKEGLPLLTRNSNVFICDHCWSPEPIHLYEEWKSNEALRTRLEPFFENPEPPTPTLTLEERIRTCDGKNLELDDLELEAITPLSLPTLFPNLETLSLWGNNLRNVADLLTTLSSLPNLRALWIKSNPLNDAPGIKESILSICPKLEIYNSVFTNNYTEWALLYISHSSDASTIANLDLSDREISSLKMDVFKPFKNVAKADFTGNSVDLSHITDYLPNLYSIKCDEEQIPTLPKTIVFVNGVDPETGDVSMSVPDRIWDHIQAAGDRWGLGDEVALSIHHSLNGNCNSMPCGSPKTFYTYFIFWPNRDLQPLEEITSNLYPLIQFGSTSEVERPILPMQPLTSKFKSSVCTKRPIKVYLDNSTFKSNLHSDKFEIVENPNEADLQWISYHDTRDYEEIYKNHILYNQIEGEQYTTIKDMMYENVLEYMGEVKWLPKTFILCEPEDVTGFLEYDRKLKSSSQSSAWIVKAFNQTRGTFMVVTESPSEVLRHASVGPRLTQRYIWNPLLISGVKFDLRYIVLLKSVKPMELFAYKVFWPRLSPKKWALDDFDDYERHFTVMNYRAPSKVTHKTYVDFIEMFENENKGIKWDTVQQKIYEAIRDLFKCGCQKMVATPYTKAMYGIDVMVTNDLEPIILECNFQPDCKRACNLCPTFVDDVFEVLYVEQPVTNDKVVQIN
ncbi:tubulin--tyrosine ligase-like protein 12 [Histomonas meleagridis]|uniref:tubulin--tyrosine ligase-like protein 12 n=1 Tax=Histomonas meleagridis TaxID=135588 RepID=UPI0035596F8C|nr:tubulin--tyrosine ligase-like protein 12 [Histomonas meleagridis]KAH0797709.1 tubulin--tyrosine ligase-like protein 12 [Histomonas meleagridis]